MADEKYVVTVDSESRKVTKVEHMDDDGALLIHDVERPHAK